MEAQQPREHNLVQQLNRLNCGLSERYLGDMQTPESYLDFRAEQSSSTGGYSISLSRARLVSWSYTTKKGNIKKLKYLVHVLEDVTNLSIIENWIRNARALKMNIVYPLISKATKEVELNFFKIKGKCFKRIFVACRTIKKLTFRECSIITKEFDLSRTLFNINFKIQELLISNCEESERQERYKNHFEIIFFSISESTLKHSLKQVKLYHPKEDENTAEQMSKEYSLPTISITIQPFPN
ncbi:unnamed protein product [Moneuplotes crassus]|uniref:Uncharacterized protein n=1 Tax=Euplotes crassus TaxID=5936 RepID=A0AAD2D2R4_EUPCR|nr:unnamed protein product [Moneuplotes crassus]